MAEALKHEELTERIIKVFYSVYNELGMVSWSQSTKNPWMFVSGKLKSK